MIAMHPLTFAELRKANVSRQSHFGHDKLGPWRETDYGCALAGETGELCNLLKKRRRGDHVDLADIAKEAADVATYLDLLCDHLGIDLGQAVVDKFNKVSERRNLPHKL